MTCLEAALAYRKRGLCAVPAHNAVNGICTCKDGSNCSKPGKHPRVAWTEFQDRLPTEAEISAWWKQWPDANVGIITGKVSGIAVLDADTPDALQDKHMPPTPTVRTSRGEHRWFAHPGNGRRVKSAIGFLPGLDCRADGGFVMAPPSTHPSGVRYEWAEGCSLEDMDLAPCPQWILEAVEGSEAKEQGIAEDGAEIPEGKRDTTLFSLACSMRARGLTQPEICAALRAINSSRCKPPLPDGEVEKIAESAAGYDPGSPALERAMRTGIVEAEQRFSTLLSHKDLVTGELAPVSWLVEGLIPEGSVCLLAGDAGVGKSWLGYHLAQCCAAGIPFLGRFPTQPGGVLYLDAESGENLLRRRFKKLWNGLAEERPDLPLWLLPAMMKLDAEGCEALAERIAQDDIRLCILDPMIHFADADENSSREMANFLEGIRQVGRDTGCSFLLVHHVRKESRMHSNAAGQMIRGSSAIRGVLDSYLYAQKLHEGTLLVTHDKSRQAEALPAFTVEITDPDEATTCIHYLAEAKTSESDRKEIAEAVIIRTIADGGGNALRQDILAQCKIEGIGRTATTVLKELFDKGIIGKRPEGKKTVYTLPESDLFGED